MVPRLILTMTMFRIDQLRYMRRIIQGINVIELSDLMIAMFSNKANLDYLRSPDDFHQVRNIPLEDINDVDFNNVKGERI